MKIKRRTQADGCQETQGNLWRQAGGEERLQDVDRKGESDHGLARRVNHQHSDPQAQEAEGEKRTGGLMKSGEEHRTLTHTQHKLITAEPNNREKESRRRRDALERWR